jgi:hypothetical protein
VTPRTLQHSPVPAAQRKIAPEMPRIPGVTQERPRPAFQLKPLLAVILATLICAAGFAVWVLRRRQADLRSAVPAEAAMPQDFPNASSPMDSDSEPNTIGTLYELAAPWSSKKFFFVDPNTHEGIPAIVIHLPGSPAQPSFWAFSLKNQFSPCQLQYVTDLTAISQHFAYPAEHPMVVSDCEGILYDPLKMATLSDGAWVRGEIVRGGGIRPPISIQVEVHGRNVVAKRIE